MKTQDLTGKLMKSISLYYGLAIQQNPDSIENMRKAIWAIFYHQISTNENPRHEYCSIDWCKYLKAQAENTTFNHKAALSDEMQEVVEPIFHDLTDENLLKRCLGKNTQNNNECFNSLIWSMVPKHNFTSGPIVEIAAWIAACLFNEGSTILLNILESMGVNCGANAYNYTVIRDKERIRKAEFVNRQSTKEARIAKKEALEEMEEIYKICMDSYMAQESMILHK